MSKTPESRDWLTTGEAAAILEIDVSTAQEWADLGHLSSYRLPSGHRRITKASVEELRDKMRSLP